MSLYKEASCVHVTDGSFLKKLKWDKDENRLEYEVMLTFTRQGYKIQQGPALT